ncbi:hypothetical protein MASR1M42_25010 [Azonexus hydrophilus]
MTTETKSVFARRLGVAPSYVTKLAQAGRLIVVDGQIEVETSLALIEATKDPNRDDVRQRHAQARDGKRLGRPAATPPARETKTRQDKASGSPPAAKPMLKAASAFREARADRMHYQARQAEIKLAVTQGKLSNVATINKCGATDGAMLRTLLENLPDQAAPRLAAVRDPAEAARILGGLLDDIEATMNDLMAKHSATMRQRLEGGGDAD